MSDAFIDSTDRAWVDEFVANHREELVAIRRHLHAHPELSGQELETTRFITSRLTASGLEPRVLPSGTGVVCDVGGGDEPPRVALRCDIDALAMDDLKSVSYRSERPGVAHACGHDVHTAVLLGAGLALDRHLHRDRVRLLFEPSEETVPGGAVEIIETGELDGIEATYGLHCDPKVDLGTIGVRSGPITSAADQIDLELHGPGGHTARPHLTVNLVAVASRAVIEVPVRLAELAAPGEVLLVFGALMTGEAPNVIPTQALLRGSLRTADRDVWDRAEALLMEAVTDVVGPTGATWTLRHHRGVPPVVNHPRETDLLAAAARRVVGEDCVIEAPRSAGGDSFAWYLERTGGTYARLGTHAGGDERLDLHAGTFDVHEDAIAIGLATLIHVTLDELDC